MNLKILGLFSRSLSPLIPTRNRSFDFNKLVRQVIRRCNWYQFAVFLPNSLSLHRLPYQICRRKQIGSEQPVTVLLFIKLFSPNLFNYSPSVSPSRSKKRAWPTFAEASLLLARFLPRHSTIWSAKCVICNKSRCLIISSTKNVAHPNPYLKNYWPRITCLLIVFIAVADSSLFTRSSGFQFTHTHTWSSENVQWSSRWSARPFLFVCQSNRSNGTYGMELIGQFASVSRAHCFVFDPHFKHRPCSPPNVTKTEPLFLFHS